MMKDKVQLTLEDFQNKLGDKLDISIDSLKHNKHDLNILLSNCIVKFGYEEGKQTKKVVLTSNKNLIGIYFKGIGVSTMDMNSRLEKLRKAKLSTVNDINTIASMNLVYCHYGTFPLKKWWVEDWVIIDKDNVEKINNFLVSINKNWKLIKK